ncbi:MAG: 23S rRNA accumulation protein YceD [Congregibacter sp.]
MSAGPLSQRVNIRKAVTREALYEGTLGASQLSRFADVLAAAEAPLRLRVQFGVDEEAQQHIDVEMSAAVTLECQRCLGTVQAHLSKRTQLGLVLTDEQAKHLSPRYEPWIAEEEDVDLWAIAEEELALALPVVAYHPEGECDGPGASFFATEVVGGGAVESGDENDDAPNENPFSVLSTLLEGSESKEK